MMIERPAKTHISLVTSAHAKTSVIIYRRYIDNVRMLSLAFVFETLLSMYKLYDRYHLRLL